MQIIIFDQHPLYRKALIQMLNQWIPSGISAHECDDTHRLINLTDEQSPDYIIADPLQQGVDETVFDQILQLPHQPVTILLTSPTNHTTLLKWVAKPISAYLFKSDTISEIEQAVLTVINGNTYYNQTVSHAIRRSMSGLRSPVNQELSAKELEVLQLICQQYTNQEIASMLNISSRTVENHRNRMIKKMGVKNVIGLAVLALAKGIVKPPPIRGGSYEINE